MSNNSVGQASNQSLKTPFAETAFFTFVRLDFRAIALNYKSNKNFGYYSGLNLNQYGVASPCRTICTVCGFVALS